MPTPSASDTLFAGSIPGLYDRYLGPLLFEPYAEEVAGRARAVDPGHVLETAAGTGIVTKAVHRVLPDAHIIATDLNPAMLEVAAERVPSKQVTFEPADALDLRFADESFDLVVCQFGIMFFPDRVHGNAEARRVLRNGGRLILGIWDRLDRNPASQITHDVVAGLFPDDPPSFLAGVPFAYADPAQIEHDLLEAGFDDVEFETVALKSRRISARDAAIGLVSGCPLRSEIEQRDPDGVQHAVDVVADALKMLESNGVLDSGLSAHIVTATK